MRRPNILALKQDGMPLSKHMLLQVGERVSIVCAPTERSAQSTPQQQQQRLRLFGSGPPFTKPGQPLSLNNHAAGREHPLQPPPSSAAGIPGWVLPAAVMFSASDAASGEALCPISAPTPASCQHCDELFQTCAADLLTSGDQKQRLAEAQSLPLRPVPSDFIVSPGVTERRGGFLAQV